MRCPVLEEFIYEGERCAIFIDGPSLHHACQSLDIEIDYGLLRSIFSEAGYLVQARYYTTIQTDQSYTPVRPLIDWLSYNGFIVVAKPVKAGDDDDEPWRRIRGVGIELAVDVVEISPRLDHVVLFTGNGDFLRLVKLMQRRTVRTTVISTMQSSSLTSDELRRQADMFIDLRSLMPFVKKERLQSPGLRGAG